MLLDYAAIYPNAVIQYYARNMVLHVDSDAAYITILEAQSVYSGIFYLRDWPSPDPVKLPPK